MSKKEQDDGRIPAPAAEVEGNKRGRGAKEGRDGRQERDSTLAALLKEKPRRGRPRRAISRQNVYVALDATQKETMKRLAARLPDSFSRADIPDLAITILTVRLEELRRAVADRNREIPEGVTDLDSLNLLWDLPLPAADAETKWTSIRLSPQQGVELGRTQGTLNALFGANRSQVFALGLALLEQLLAREQPDTAVQSIEDAQKWIANIYL